MIKTCFVVAAISPHGVPMIGASRFATREAAMELAVSLAEELGSEDYTPPQTLKWNRSFTVLEIVTYD